MASSAAQPLLAAAGGARILRCLRQAEHHHAHLAPRSPGLRELYGVGLTTGMENHRKTVEKPWEENGNPWKNDGKPWEGT